MIAVSKLMLLTLAVNSVTATSTDAGHWAVRHAKKHVNNTIKVMGPQQPALNGTVQVEHLFLP